MELHRFDWSVQPYFTGQEVEITFPCNAIEVINIAGVGGTICLVNNVPINAALVAGANGESWSIGGNLGEVIQKKQITLSFPNGNGAVLVIQKFYVTNC